MPIQSQLSSGLFTSHLGGNMLTYILTWRHVRMCHNNACRSLYFFPFFHAIAPRLNISERTFRKEKIFQPLNHQNNENCKKADTFLVNKENYWILNNKNKQTGTWSAWDRGPKLHWFNWVLYYICTNKLWLCKQNSARLNEKL